ncbi:hypothetical protein OQA88_12594 [Cercophora sp. LCS_1]
MAVPKPSGLSDHQARSPRGPNWKPWAFHPLYIIFICILHILYIVGIQLIVNKSSNDAEIIQRVQQNETIDSPDSMFVFDENNMNAYLTWQYLPIALATILAILWESLDLTVRRLEPFHQLSLPEGGDVDNSLCLEYTGTFSFTVPFRALRYRHYAVVMSSSIFVVVATIITALSGGMWGIEWASLSYSSERTNGPKWATVSVNTGVAIATQVLHGLVVAGGLLLAAILHFRQSGLYHDPKGIGGIASLISDSDYIEYGALNIFRQLPSFAHSKIVRGSLRGIRFKLQHVPVTQQDGSTQLVYQLTTTTDPGYVVPQRAEDRVLYRDRWDATGFFLTKRAAFIAECIIWLAQAAIIGALYQIAKIGTKLVAGDDSGGSTATKSTIAKIIYTLSLTVGGVMWQSIQRELQIFEPWQRLRKRKQGGSVYDSLVQSDFASLGLLGSAFLATAKLKFIEMWAAFAVLAVYAATVFVPPLLELAYAAGLGAKSPLPSKTFGIMSGASALSLAAGGIAIHLVILCNMFFVMMSGRTKPFLPRRPSNIASQILYLCHSDRLLSDFRGTATISDRTVLAGRLDGVNRRCGFGWFCWQRGQAWCMAVEEEDSGPDWFQFSWGTPLSQGTRYA